MSWVNIPSIVAAVAIATYWPAVQDALAQPEPIGSMPNADGITVSGSGEAKIKPSRMEIEIKATASAELSGDAIVKYRDALKSAKEAFARLKLANLVVEEQGVLVSPNVSAIEEAEGVGISASASGARARQEIAIWKTLRLTLTEIDKMKEEEVVAAAGRILDTAKDAGLMSSVPANTMVRVNNGMIPASIITFLGDNSQTAEQKAREQAFQEAKDRAERLAALAGTKLGSVLSIEEAETVPSSDGMDLSPNDRLTSYLLGEMPVRVNLRVRFALAPQNSGVAAK